jgi:hypothetical protein
MNNLLTINLFQKFNNTMVFAQKKMEDSQLVTVGGST